MTSVFMRRAKRAAFITGGVYQMAALFKGVQNLKSVDSCIAQRWGGAVYKT